MKIADLRLKGGGSVPEARPIPVPRSLPTTDESDRWGEWMFAPRPSWGGDLRSVVLEAAPRRAMSLRPRDPRTPSCPPPGICDGDASLEERQGSSTNAGWKPACAMPLRPTAQGLAVLARRSPATHAKGKRRGTIVRFSEVSRGITIAGGLNGLNGSNGRVFLSTNVRGNG